ncbi:hypothetical protein GCM10011345_17830 [Gemmobacter megaterium]|nr:hypothetical protein GCM10011345_17830 [Gemmobacter megaterium]
MNQILVADDIDLGFRKALAMIEGGLAGGLAGFHVVLLHRCLPNVILSGVRLKPGHRGGTSRSACRAGPGKLG